MRGAGHPQLRVTPRHRICRALYRGSSSVIWARQARQPRARPACGRGAPAAAAGGDGGLRRCALHSSAQGPQCSHGYTDPQAHQPPTTAHPLHLTGIPPHAGGAASAAPPAPPLGPPASEQPAATSATALSGMVLGHQEGVDPWLRTHDAAAGPLLVYKRNREAGVYRKVGTACWVTVLLVYKRNCEAAAWADMGPPHTRGQGCCLTESRASW